MCKVVLGLNPNLARGGHCQPSMSQVCLDQQGPSFSGGTNIRTLAAVGCEGRARGVEGPGPVLCPAVESGMDPLLAVWPGQVLPLQWQCCYNAVKGPWWQTQTFLACACSELKRQKPEAFRARPRSARLAAYGSPS